MEICKDLFKKKGFGMPSARHMEHKNSHDGNYDRYAANMDKLYNPDGTMKPGEPTPPDPLPKCGECPAITSDCRRLILRGCFECRAMVKEILK